VGLLDIFHKADLKNPNAPVPANSPSDTVQLAHFASQSQKTFNPRNLELAYKKTGASLLMHPLTNQ
jgi:hypothetical protein